jgi:hypothetical protein
VSQPIVLIIFHCQTGATEQLALNTAVGAVQGRALIRLRRLPDIGMTVDNEELLRMRKEYVPPTEKDILGADGLIIVAAPNFSDSDLQWKPYVELLRRLGGANTLKRKVACGIGLNDDFFSGLGVNVLFADRSTDALTIGRGIAEAARSLKQEQEPS